MKKGPNTATVILSLTLALVLSRSATAKELSVKSLGNPTLSELKNSLGGPKPTSLLSSPAPTLDSVQLKGLIDSLKLGGSNGGGGDPMALEFIRIFDEVKVEIKDSMSEVYPKLVAKNFNEIFSNGGKVYIVDETLDVKINEFFQRSPVVNFPELKIILINRSAWKKIVDVALKKALVLHEALSLIGLECSGDYSISHKYFEPKEITQLQVATTLGEICGDICTDSSTVWARAFAKADHLDEASYQGKKIFYVGRFENVKYSSMAAFVDFSGPIPMFSQGAAGTDLSDPNEWRRYQDEAIQFLNREQQPLERIDSTKDYVTAVKDGTHGWKVISIRSKGHSILIKKESYNPKRELTSVRFSYGKAVKTTSDSE